LSCRRDNLSFDHHRAAGPVEIAAAKARQAAAGGDKRLAKIAVSGKKPRAETSVQKIGKWARSNCHGGRDNWIIRAACHKTCHGKPRRRDGGNLRGIFYPAFLPGPLFAKGYSCHPKITDVAPLVRGWRRKRRRGRAPELTNIPPSWQEVSGATPVTRLPSAEPPACERTSQGACQFRRREESGDRGLSRPDLS
jgi:hypothetical protein